MHKRPVRSKSFDHSLSESSKRLRTSAPAISGGVPKIRRPSDIVFDARELMNIILSFVFNLRLYGSLCRVSKHWNQHVFHNNFLWWPLFQRLWRTSAAGQVIESDDTHYARHMREVVIPQNVERFAPRCRGGSWQEQFQARQSQQQPRLVYFDCSDGRAFLPTAGWCRYVTNADKYFPYDEKSEYFSPWSDANLMVKMLDHVDWQSEEEEPVVRQCGMTTSHASKKKAATIRHKHIASEFLEFRRRLMNNSVFCLHWTNLSDFECFPALPNPPKLEHVLRDDAQVCRSAKLSNCTHDVSSGWLCDSRCAAIIPGLRYPENELFDQDFVYKLVTAAEDVSWVNQGFNTYRVLDIKHDCFGLEREMRVRAGYRDINDSNDANDYLLCDVTLHGQFWDDWNVSICGLKQREAKHRMCVAYQIPGEQLSRLPLANETCVRAPGCGRFMGPGMRFHRWKLPCGHETPLWYLDYCPDCCSRFETEAKMFGSMIKGSECAKCKQDAELKKSVFS